MARLTGLMNSMAAVAWQGRSSFKSVAQEKQRRHCCGHPGVPGPARAAGRAHPRRSARHPARPRTPRTAPRTSGWGSRRPSSSRSTRARPQSRTAARPTLPSRWRAPAPSVSARSAPPGAEFAGRSAAAPHRMAVAAGRRPAPRRRAPRACQWGSNTGSAASQPAVARCRSPAAPQPLTGRTENAQRALPTVEGRSPAAPASHATSAPARARRCRLAAARAAAEHMALSTVMLLLPVRFGCTRHYTAGLWQAQAHCSEVQLLPQEAGACPHALQTSAHGRQGEGVRGRLRRRHMRRRALPGARLGARSARPGSPPPPPRQSVPAQAKPPSRLPPASAFWRLRNSLDTPHSGRQKGRPPFGTHTSRHHGMHKCLAGLPGPGRHLRDDALQRRGRAASAARAEAGAERERVRVGPEAAHVLGVLQQVRVVRAHDLQGARVSALPAPALAYCVAGCPFRLCTSRVTECAKQPTRGAASGWHGPRAPGGAPVRPRRSGSCCRRGPRWSISAQSSCPPLAASPARRALLNQVPS